MFKMQWSSEEGTFIQILMVNTCTNLIEKIRTRLKTLLSRARAEKLGFEVFPRSRADFSIKFVPWVNHQDLNWGGQVSIKGNYTTHIRKLTSI